MHTHFSYKTVLIRVSHSITLVGVAKLHYVYLPYGAQDSLDVEGTIDVASVLKGDNSLILLGRALWVSEW